MIEIIVDLGEGESIEDKEEWKLKTKLENCIGDKIVSAGFGKFSFSPFIFSKLELVMPTI